MKKFLLLLTVLAAVFIPTTVSATPEAKVTICHRTNADSNPYVLITVSANAVDGEGHNDHTLHVASETHLRADIIPAPEAEGVPYCPGPTLPSGPAGPQGPAGPPGADGKDGIDGGASTVPGPVGAQGSQGAPGADSSVPGPVGAPGAAAQAGVTAVQHNCTTPDGYGYTTSYPNCGVAAPAPAPAPVQPAELPRTGISGWFWMLGALMLLSGVCLRLFTTTGRKA